MSDNWSDESRVEKAFAEWRASEMGDAPPFYAVYQGARARAAEHERALVPPAARRWALLAAAVLIGIGTVLLRPRGVPSSGLTHGVPSLSDWRSPTAFLLHGPGDALVNTVPNFSAPTIELNGLAVPATHRRSL